MGMRGDVSVFEVLIQTQRWTILDDTLRFQWVFLMNGFEHRLPVEAVGLQLLQDIRAAWWASWVCCTDSLEMVGENSTLGWPACLSAQGWPGTFPTQWWCCYRGNVYQWGYKKKIRKDAKEGRNVWKWLTLEVHPPCSESQNQACSTILHQSISSEHRWDAHYCRGHRSKTNTISTFVLISIEKWMRWPYICWAYLKNVYCLPYIQGLRVRLGYSPNGGTIRVNVRARKTKLAGKTICTGRDKKNALCKQEKNSHTD